MDFRVVLFAGFFITGLQSECLRGWFHYGNSCYFISHTLKTWVNAEGFCRTYNSYLATIETEGENIFLTDTITLIQNGVGKRDIHDLTQDFWIGGTDEVIEGVWVWASTGKDLTYTNWEPGQPDNWKNENCLSLVWWNVPGKWNDWYCSRNCHFICETEFPASGSIIG
ncbi:perlucin-like [Mytilus edulis]|uniref:perlucin-like n=1 Tax=Mytilus edulis TaxID=6550 RepID=UPI0039EE32C4